MIVEHSRKGKLAVLRYESFHVTALLGSWNSGQALEEVPFLYGKDVDFGNILAEPQRLFLAGFKTEPAVDITFVSAKDGLGSIVAYSLSDEEPERLVRIPEHSLFSASEPSQEFIGGLEYELIGVQSKTYEMCKQAALSGIDFQNFFGAVHYTNFLANYKGVRNDDAYRHAVKLYNL